MDKKTASFICFIMLVMFGIGVFVGPKLVSSRNSGALSKTPGENQKNFQAGWETAKKRISETGLCRSAGEGEIKKVFGKIEKINGSALTVKITPLEPLADAGLDTRIIKVGSDTKIYKLIPKDTGQFQKELDQFNKSPGVSSELPSFFEKQEAGLADIQKGHEIEVLTGSDIKNQKQFSASEIDIQNAVYRTIQ